MCTTWVSHAHHMDITCTPHGYHMHTTWISHAHHNTTYLHQLPVLQPGVPSKPVTCPVTEYCVSSTLRDALLCRTLLTIMCRLYLHLTISCGKDIQVPTILNIVILFFTQEMVREGCYMLQCGVCPWGCLNQLVYWNLLHLYRGCSLYNYLILEGTCGLAQHSRIHKQKIASLSPISANVLCSWARHFTVLAPPHLGM